MMVENSAKIILRNGDLDNLRSAIEGEIANFINSLPASNSLSEAIIYILKCGGKRIRPLITLSILADLGQQAENFAACAVALELLHVASLVHDDLPALDNDNFRRGLKTCHVKFNESTAILTGDVLVPMALNYLLSSKISAKGLLNITALLTEAYRDLCFGQQLDLNPQNFNLNNSEVARLKTGALFSAAIAIPFEIVPGLDAYFKIAKETGLQLGILYQICDDFADNNDSNFKDMLQSTRLLIDPVHSHLLLLISALEKSSEGRGLVNLRNTLNYLFSPFEAFEIQF
jgi:geranylgeranyl diphosphate synthase type II